MKSPFFKEFIGYFRSAAREFPDKRTGTNKTYPMEDIALSAFSVFFTQSPSFPAFQRSMEKTEGKNNARTLFGIGKIPGDNHIRDISDEVSPDHIFPVYDKISEKMESCGISERFLFLRGSVLSNFN